jgi:signal transduction histidine kinase
MPYNAGMEHDRAMQPTTPSWMDAATYVAIIVMGAIGLSGLDDARLRLVLVVLCVAFGGLYTAVGRTARIEERAGVYFAACAALVAGMIALPSRTYDALHFLLFTVAMQAVAVLPERAAARWMALFIAISAATTLLHRGFGADALIPLAFNSAVFLLIGTFGQAWHQTEVARRRNAELVAELEAAQQQIRSLAVAEERNRLAREVHDSVGHRLTVAVVQLEGAKRLIPSDPARAAGMVEAMREEMKEGLAELRRTVSALREGGERPTLAVALAQLARDFQERTGLVVHLSLPPVEPPLPESHRQALYRVAQESLTNVQRHAAARQSWLSLAVGDGEVELTVADDGRGWGDTPGRAGGFGLRGMRERVGELGGTICLAERPGHGAEVRARVPLPRQEAIR